MKKGTLILAGFLLLAGVSAFAAESFRVRSINTVTIDSQKPETQTIELGYNDAIGIAFAQDTTFIKAVEIEIKIPQKIIEYQNSMAWGIYNRVQPAPSEKKIDYQAEQIAFQPLPSRLSFVLQIPLSKEHGLKTGPYATVLQYVHDAVKGPLLFRLQPIMKGLPEDIESMTFPVRIKPILSAEGGARVSIAYPDDPAKPVSIRIDDVPVENPARMQILSPGSHHLSIVSDDYRNEVRVFTVEAARVTTVEVKMQDTTPRLFIAAPENTEIFLDETKIETAKDGRTLEPGEHSVRLKIGGYEVTRPLTVEKGKDYTVSMIIDLNIAATP